MGNLIQYRSLFSTQLLHEYYLPGDSSLFQGISSEQQEKIVEKQQNNYKVNRDFDISPTTDCMKILKNLRLLFKQNNFGFSVVSEAISMGDGTFVPFVPLTESFRLRFTVRLKNQHIVNFTNLQLKNENNDHSVYYLSNRANNLVSPGALYLSQEVPGFDPSSTYQTGDIIIDSTNPANPVMLEAIEHNGPGPFDNSQWHQIYPDQDPLPQFITREDRIALRPGVFKHNVESAGREHLTFIIKDREGGILLTNSFNTSEPGIFLSVCELKLTDLPPAYYILEVRDGTGTVFPELGLRFFMDDDLYAQQPFALIECFHEPDGSLGDYRLLDQENENRLLSPSYIIHLKNRSTFWRYYFNEAPSFNSSQVEVYEPTPGNPIDRVLVSSQPLGLTQFSRLIEIEIGGDTFFLPNPDVASIFPEGNRLYSEINMGGGLGPPQ